MKLPFLKSTDDVHAWAQRLVQQLNARPDYIGTLPVYADDAAAGAAGIPVEGGYRATDGTVRWRVA